MRYFIRFSYRGTAFHGSQVQPNGHTVQAELEHAMATILRQPVTTTFAGRTDAGVHADCMIAHFDMESELPINLCGRLNSLLSDAIAIQSIEKVKSDAHARFDATQRTYHYRIITKKDPFLYLTRTRVQEGLDYEAMNRAAQLLLGKQDFASFCRTHTDVKTTICDIKEAKWVIENEYMAYFTITADRFLRNMVRAIVGTLFEIGRGRMTKQQLAEIITAHDRCKAGHSAPAEGLSLIDIKYPNNIYHE
jgi:tRNA pseudouridine38-40 synthase